MGAMASEDSLQRFLFEEVGVRGELVRLTHSWQAVLGRHSYPETVRDQLGEAMAAVLLLSATIKFSGSLILQIQGDGPLSTLVTQATDLRTVRGLAHWRNDVPRGPLAAVFGEGRLLLTIQNEAAEPYQGVVPLSGAHLSDALESYFNHSEQLATRLWLAADGVAAAGLLLQEIPSHQRQTCAWHRIAMLASAISSAQLLQSAGPSLLCQLFRSELVRLFEPEPVTFRCGCTRDRIERVLAALGRMEIDEILSTQQHIDVQCEFCNRLYQFDAVDAGALFAASAPAPKPSRHH